MLFLFVYFVGIILCLLVNVDEEKKAIKTIKLVTIEGFVGGGVYCCFE